MGSRFRLRRWRRCTGKLPDRAEHFQPVPERQAEVFQGLIREVGKDREINTIFGKALCILGQAKLCEPLSDLLHCGPLRI